MEENISRVQPVEAPLKQSKPWLKPLLFSILGIVLAGSLVFAGFQLGKKQAQKAAFLPTPAPISFPTPTSAPPATPIIDPTANWKTYTNTKYKYTLRYPLDWQIHSLGNVDINTFSAPNFGSPCNYELNQLCSYMYVEYTPVENGGGISFEANDEISNETTLRLDYEKAGGFDVWRPNASDFSGTEYQTHGSLNYFVRLTHNNYKIDIFYGELKKGKEFRSAKDWENKSVFDQILSTFKFLPEDSPTSKPGEGKFCGGIAANLPENQCPPGYKCRLEGNYPDAGGKCVRD